MDFWGTTDGTCGDVRSVLFKPTSWPGEVYPLCYIVVHFNAPWNSI